MSNKITRSSAWFRKGEAQSAAAGILPGHLVQLDAAGEIVLQAASATPIQGLFADINYNTGGGPDTEYELGDSVQYGAACSGFPLVARLAVGSSANPSTPLYPAANGEVSITQTATESPVYWPEESIDNSGGSAAVKINVRRA